jgi:hypothetical protein
VVQHSSPVQQQAAEHITLRQHHNRRQPGNP